MQKHLTISACLAAVILSGCSSMEELTGVVPDLFAKTSLVYRPDVQQGNVVDQETVNKLKPNMSKSQVSYLMGTPMLMDVFHQNRWDYVYRIKKGSGETTQKRITLLFEDDRLAGMDGDFRPEPVGEENETTEEVVVTVPDYTGDEGIITRALKKVGVDAEE
ncbi:MAG: outer membrane protein assembly factor BamE [Sedimenticola sp.]